MTRATSPSGNERGNGRQGRLCRRGITDPEGGAAVLQRSERWGNRHSRPQGVALTAWGAAPLFKRDKASRQADEILVFA